MVAAAIMRLFRDEEGATMVEYAIMLMLIAAVCVATVTTIGGLTNAKFDKVASRWP